MPLESIQTPHAPAAIGPYSQGMRCSSLLFVSGQLGLDAQSGALAADFAAQTRLALENLRQILRAAGLDLEQVAAVDVFLTDMDRFSEFNGIYSESFPTHRPARAVVAVGALPRGAMVEIKCIACFP